MLLANAVLKHTVRSDSVGFVPEGSYSLGALVFQKPPQNSDGRKLQALMETPAGEERLRWGSETMDERKKKQKACKKCRIKGPDLWAHEHRSQIRRVTIDSWVGNLEAERHIVKDEPCQAFICRDLNICPHPETSFSKRNLLSDFIDDLWTELRKYNSVAFVPVKSRKWMQLPFVYFRELVLPPVAF